MVEPAPSRHRLPPAERRALIVQAAGRLFGERGFDGTRLDDVAAAAGVTKPILYRHFRDKTALYLGVLERHRDDLASFTGAFPTEGTLEDRLRIVLGLWLAYVAEHGYAWKMLFADNGGGADVQVARAQVRDRARAVLAGMIESLSERPIPAAELEPLAELMRGGMAAVALRSLEYDSVPQSATVDAMVRVWTGLLKVGGGVKVDC